MTPIDTDQASSWTLQTNETGKYARAPLNISLYLGFIKRCSIRDLIIYFIECTCSTSCYNLGHNEMSIVAAGTEGRCKWGGGQEHRWGTSWPVNPAPKDDSLHLRAHDTVDRSACVRMYACVCARIIPIRSATKIENAATVVRSMHWRFAVPGSAPLLLDTRRSLTNLSTLSAALESVAQNSPSASHTGRSNFMW